MLSGDLRTPEPEPEPEPVLMKSQTLSAAAAETYGTLTSHCSSHLDLSSVPDGSAYASLLPFMGVQTSSHSKASAKVFPTAEFVATLNPSTLTAIALLSDMVATSPRVLAAKAQTSGRGTHPFFPAARSLYVLICAGISFVSHFGNRRHHLI